MSFWPFSKSLNKNSKLQRLLDSVLDPSAVSVEDLVSDSQLLAEIVNELHNIKGNYGKNAGNFPFQQHLQQQTLKERDDEDGSLATTGVGSAGGVGSAQHDSASISSFSEPGGNISKDARGAKLLEILIQPHILNGFLDFIVESVSFFERAQQEKEAETERAAAPPDGQIEDELPQEAAVLQTGETSATLGDKSAVSVDSVLPKQPKPVLDDIDDDIEEDENENEIEDESESEEERLRRYILVASDVLSIDLWIVSNRIIETPVIMGKLWLILALPLSESSPSVSYLVRILDQLMDANSIELLNFVRRQHDLVDTFIDRIEIPMLMDFFLRIIQTDKPDSPTGILDTLAAQELIPKLVDLLKPTPSQFVAAEMDNGTAVAGIPDAQRFFKQAAATDFVKALVTISSNAALAINLETNIGPNALTRELVSSKIINIIVNDIILYIPPALDNNGAATGNISNKLGINNCVGIIIELIRKNNSDYDCNCGTYSSMLEGADGGAGSEVNSYVMFQWLKDFEQNPPGPRDPLYLGEMLEIFSDNLPKLHKLMLSVPEESKELGFSNFKISELVAELLHCSNMILLNSKKIRRVVKVREYVRSQQERRIARALGDLILSELELDNSTELDGLTHGFDDVSLDNVSLSHSSSQINRNIPRSGSDSISDVERETADTTFDDAALLELSRLDDDVDDSEDEEPVISPENPFVCEERDLHIRSNPCVGDKFKIDLVDLGVLSFIIGKFTHYPWHNFFHNVVFDLIQQIFNGKLNSYNSFLIVELFKQDKCNLPGTVGSAYREKVEPRPGYMGHLILVSEEIVKFTSLYKPDLISPIILAAVTSEEWEWFVNDILLKTREVYNSVLGADLDEDNEEEMRKGRSRGSGEGDDGSSSYGFDSSTVGYLDLEQYDGTHHNKAIILGNASNHDIFVNDLSLLDQHDKDIAMMGDANIFPNLDKDLNGGDETASQGDDGEADEEEDTNELRRVPKHNQDHN